MVYIRVFYTQVYQKFATEGNSTEGLSSSSGAQMQKLETC